MTNIQAAIGVAQMDMLPKFIKAKRNIAKKYNFYLADVDGVKLPKDSKNIIHSYWLYTVILSKNLSPFRDKILQIMLEDGIEARQVFIAASIMPLYQKYIRKNINYDESEYISKSGISLPTGVSMTREEIKRVSSSFKNALKKVSE
jgi:perosamine synthetase